MIFIMKTKNEVCQCVSSNIVKVLLHLIKEYVEKVLFVSKELSDSFGLEKLCSWKSAGIPISGYLKNNRWKYAFHGSGCSVVSSEFQVDFEFDINCIVGGFDIWRLWSFVCDNENLDADLKLFKDKKFLESTFEKAYELKLIRKEIDGKQSDLYFLVGEIWYKAG